MFPSKHLKDVGQMPWGRFVSTYKRDFTPFSEHHLQVNLLRPKSAASPIFSLLQTGHDFWPTFYKTTNSEYGSLCCSQPPQYSLSPTPLAQSGAHAAHFLGAVGSTLPEARTQDVKEAWPVEERCQLHYVLGEKGKLTDAVQFPLSAVLVPQQSQDEPQRKVELLYEEGHVRPVCREAGLQYLLHLPVVPTHISTIKGVENVDNSAFLKGFTASGLRSSASLQPFPRQCGCCAWESEHPYTCCFQMQTIPPCIHHGSTQPVAPAQHSREPAFTEYQASYTAQWTKPRIQLNSVHLPHHHILHQSL